MKWAGSIPCLTTLALGLAQSPNPSVLTGPSGHLLVVIPGDTFTMGSPASERGHTEEELAHQVRIPRTYAIATTEVTNQQFAQFLAYEPAFAKRWKAARAKRFGDPPRLATAPQSPVAAVSWYDAASYCNWLSARAKLPKQEWVYPDNIDPERGLELPSDYLHRTGYRLPTEAEWEYAARAGTTTTRHFGEDETRLTQFAWFDKNSKQVRAHPVAQLQPNQWGLYDMLGNLWEWTFDKRQPYPVGATMTDDVEDQDLRVSNEVARTRRGGSFTYDGSTVRSAHRGATTYFPNQTRDSVGFRIARTISDPAAGR
jgi:formylglycine-generating enzyme required for sulfatase activity